MITCLTRDLSRSLTLTLIPHFAVLVTTSSHMQTFFTHFYSLYVEEWLTFGWTHFLLPVFGISYVTKWSDIGIVHRNVKNNCIHSHVSVAVDERLHCN